jgi:hypothetical protein
MILRAKELMEPESSCTLFAPSVLSLRLRSCELAESQYSRTMSGTEDYCQRETAVRGAELMGPIGIKEMALRPCYIHQKRGRKGKSTQIRISG